MKIEEIIKNLNDGITKEEISKKTGFSLNKIINMIKESDYSYNRKTKKYDIITDLKNNCTDNTHKKIKELEERILKLEQNKLYYNKLDIKSYGDIVPKGIKVSEEVYYKFINTCDKHFPTYKKQDIYNYILQKFIDTYFEE